MPAPPPRRAYRHRRPRPPRLPRPARAAPPRGRPAAHAGSWLCAAVAPRPRPARLPRPARSARQPAAAHRLDLHRRRPPTRHPSRSATSGARRPLDRSGRLSAAASAARAPSASRASATGPPSPASSPSPGSRSYRSPPTIPPCSPASSSATGCSSSPSPPSRATTGSPRGEALTVFFALIARIAPLWRERRPPPADGSARPAPRSPRCRRYPDRRRLRDPRARRGQLRRPLRHLPLARPHRREPAGVPWPLHRRGPNTAGLIAAWALTAAADPRHHRARPPPRRDPAAASGTTRAPACSASCRSPPASTPPTTWPRCSPTASTLSPRSTTRSAAAGACSASPTIGSPSPSSPTRDSVTAIWNAQFALILGAHLLAVLITLRLAAPPPRAIAHLPMTGLMVPTSSSASGCSRRQPPT